MNVFIGALLTWLIIGAVLGISIFLMTAKGIFWPFIVVTVLLFWIVKRIGCTTH